MYYRTNLKINSSHINYLSYSTTIILAVQIDRGFGFEINIGLIGVNIHYGGGTDSRPGVILL